MWRIIALLFFIALLEIPMHSATADMPAVVDWAKDNIQETPSDCGRFRFTGLQDHHSYTLWVRGRRSGTCSFEATGLHFHMPPNFGPTTDKTTTLFSFVRIGPDVLTTWQPGI
jgi:hypothetical protein